MQTDLSNKLAQDQWAKLMANENIIIREDKVSTATFDIKNRVLTLPVFKESLPEHLKKMFYAHEVGHALFTAVDWFVTYQERYKIIFDVVEDAKVDRMIKLKYPGLMHTYRHGHKAAYDINLLSIKDKSVANLAFINRLNLMCKGYSEVHQESLLFNMIEKELFARSQSINSDEDALALCQSIEEYVEKTKEEIAKSILTMIDTSDEDESDEDENENENDESDEDENENENDESDEDENENENDESDEDDMFIPADDGSNESEGDANEYTKEQDGTDGQKQNSEFNSHDAEKNNIIQLTEHNGSLFTVTLPQMDLEKVIVRPLVDQTPIIKDSVHELLNVITPEGEKVFQQMLSEAHKTAMIMSSKFLAIRDAVNEQLGSEHTMGMINESLLYQYKTNDRIFQTFIEQRNEQNHSMVLLLDWSGSMSGCILKISSYLFSIIKFCEACKLPLKIYAFSDNAKWQRLLGRLIVAPIINLNKPNVMSINHQFRLIELYDSENQVETMKVLRFLFVVAAINTYDGLSSLINMREFYDKNDNVSDIKYVNFFEFCGTPMLEGLLCMFPIIKQIKQSADKVSLVLLCDGKDNTGRDLYYYEPDGIRQRTCFAKNLLITIHNTTVMINRNEFLENGALILLKEISKQLKTSVIMIDIVTHWKDYIYCEKEKGKYHVTSTPFNRKIKAALITFGHYIDRQFGKNMVVYAINESTSTDSRLIKKGNKFSSSSVLKFFSAFCSEQKITKVIAHDFIQQIK
jgi:hypothetical protein